MFIDDIEVTEYISGISQTINKVYDNFACFAAADGTEKKKTKGTQTVWNISLDCVPTEIKNQIKARNKKDIVRIIMDDDSIFWASLRGFSSTCYNSKYWSCSFTLTERVKKVSTEDKYKLRIYNTETDYIDYSLSNDIIIDDVKISINAGGIPTAGVLASQMSFSLDRSNTEFIAPVTSAKVDVVGFTTPDYFITSRTYTENVASFTLTDRTIFLDLPFDSTRVSDKVNNGYVDIDEVLNVIVLDCNFYGHRTEGVTMSKILYSDIENTTCRQILQIISECSVGVFYCDEGNNLVFQCFGSGDYEKVIDKSRRTDITEGIIKNIKGIIATNDESGQTYRQGTTSDSYSCFKISSKYIDEELSTQIYNIVFDKTYREFTIEKSEIDRFVRIGTKIYEDSSKEGNCYIVSSSETHITQNGAFAKLGADAIQESEWDFEGNLTRALRNRIEENKKYNGVSIGKNGLICEGTAGKVTLSDGSVYFFGTGQDEKYGFNTKNGGFTTFEGIFSSSKSVSSVSVDTSTNTVTVTYTDGHVYKYSADIQKDGTNFNITNEQEEFQ